MEMEDLNKTQIVLLTLLVSFVTSIATGIVTVTLLDQAPPGVTQTINRVVEKTVRIIVPGKIQSSTVIETIIVREEDLIVDAIQKNSPHVVGIGTQSMDEDGVATLEFFGSGFIVSAEGLIITDTTQLPEEQTYFVIETVEGTRFNAEVIDTTHDLIALLRVSDSIEEKTVDAPRDQSSNNLLESSDLQDDLLVSNDILFDPVIFTDNNVLQIGQRAILLGYDNGVIPLIGTVIRLEKITSSDEDGSDILHIIHTTINADQKYSGGSLLNTDGEVIGMSFVTNSGGYVGVSTYEIKTFLDAYNEKSQEE